MKTLATFEPSSFYHIFNRANGDEKLFQNAENRTYFLRQYNKYLSKFVDTYAYALLDNHFHFCISVKSFNDIINNIESIPKKKRTKTMDFLISKEQEIPLDNFITSQFSRFFISYSQAYNKMYHRKGSLFIRPFKRTLIKSESRFGYILFYIHHNARKHGLVKNFKEYPWQSFHEILSTDETFLNREYIFNWFGGRQKFIDFHNAEFDLK